MPRVLMAPRMVSIAIHNTSQGNVSQGLQFQVFETVNGQVLSFSTSAAPRDAIVCRADNPVKNLSRNASLHCS